MRSPRLSTPAVRYGLAIAAAAAAVAAKELLSSTGLDMRFQAYVPVVVIAGFLSGFGPALTAAGLTALGDAMLSQQPIGTPAIADPAELAVTATFLANSALVGGLAGILRRDREQALLREQRLEHLLALTSALGNAHSREAAAELLLGFGRESLGASSGVVTLVGQPGGRVDVLRRFGADDLIGGAERPERGSASPLARAIWAGEVGWTKLVDTPRSARFSRHSGGARHAVAYVPLGTAPTSGAVGLGFEGFPFTESFKSLLLSAASQAHQALARIRLEDEQRDLLVQARERAQLGETFVSVLSHELRTPVTTVLGISELLMREGSTFRPAEIRELWSDVHIEADRLDRIIADLLILTRAERGVLGLEAEPILLQRILAELVRHEGRRVPSATIALHAAPDLPAVIGERTAVEQILRNYLSNAIKYGGERGLVEIVAEAQVDGVSVRVLDSGPGFPALDEAQLFRLFFRGTNARRTAGSGIGLYVVGRLVDALGGRAWARTRAEGGAEFGFWLRYADVDDAADGRVASRGSRRSSAARRGAEDIAISL